MNPTSLHRVTMKRGLEFIMLNIPGFVSLMFSRHREFTITRLARPLDLSIVLGVNTIFVSRTDMLLSSSSLLFDLQYDII